MAWVAGELVVAMGEDVAVSRKDEIAKEAGAVFGPTSAARPCAGYQLSVFAFDEDMDPLSEARRLVRARGRGGAVIMTPGMPLKRVELRCGQYLGAYQAGF